MSNSRDVATDGAGDSPKFALSDEQRAAFWAAVLRHREVAGAMARRSVDKNMVDDVVDSAAVKFIEELERTGKAARYLADDAVFGRTFLTIVRHHAIDCVRGAKKPKRPVHAHWGKAPEPTVGGRKVPDRPLDRIFVRNDLGDYDAPAPAVPRDRDDVDQLDQILRCHVATLPRMQREVVTQTFFEGRKRAEVAAKLGISVKTYDNHMQPAYRTLRHLLSADADTFTDVDRTVWYDLIEELRERYEESRIRRASTKGRALSNLEGARSNPAGDANKPARSDAA